VPVTVKCGLWPVWAPGRGGPTLRTRRAESGANGFRRALGRSTTKVFERWNRARGLALGVGW